MVQMQPVSMPNFSIKFSTGTVSGQQISFVFVVSDNTLLTEVAMVALVYSNSLPATILSYYGSNSYTSDLAGIDATFPVDAMVTGYNQKCVFGFKTFTAALTDYLRYDTNNLPGAPDFNKSINKQLVYFCMIEDYNCTLIDP
jgi:hypothetical protein